MPICRDLRDVEKSGGLILIHIRFLRLQQLGGSKRFGNEASFQALCLKVVRSSFKGEISSDLYHALQCDIEISKVKSFELEKK